MQGRVKLKGVIFDLDGTLINTLDTFTASFNQGIGLFGLNPVSSDKMAFFLNRGVLLKDMLYDLFPGIFEKEEIRQQVLDELRKAYVKHARLGVQLLPGVEEVLPRLREMGLKIGILTARVTSGDIKWVELRRLGIDRYIDAMVTAADAERKPAAGSLLECIRRLELSPAECVMVGDSQVDILTGKAASVKTIALTTGVANRETLSRDNPDVIMDSFTDLPVYIRQLI